MIPPMENIKAQLHWTFFPRIATNIIHENSEHLPEIQKQQGVTQSKVQLAEAQNQFDIAKMREKLRLKKS